MTRPAPRSRGSPSRGAVRFAAAVLALMVAIVPAAAQQTEKQKAIADLLRLTGATNIMQQMAAAVVKQMAATAKKRNPRIPDRALEILGEEVLRTFREHSAELVAAITDIYDRQYTLGEINDIIAFYRTPTGRKTIRTLPTIVRDSMAAAQGWAAKVAPAAVKRARARLRAEGYKLK